ncbi:MAG: dynamin family protein, partial [Spirochaetaceae bacterium]|nr:dynamin family protein [Spirochaetaceae bacterium]
VDKSRIERTVDNSLKDNPKQGSYDQYERMQKSGIMESVYSASFKETMPIEAGSLDDLMGKLGEYVSANGKYMPFTKSVVLNLNIPELKDIQIVDTPGVNDPVKSREKRTEDYLGECDVVFVVSPAGEFLSKEDLDLMAHISGKKGVQEVFLVASRSDQQLYGSIKDDSKGQLLEAVNLIRGQLSSQAKEVFTQKTKQNPESAEMYDKLIGNMENRVVITSSICESLLQHIDDRSSWDEDMKFAYSRLSEEYPDYFDENASKESLKSISGVSKVKDDIVEVRSMKDEIIAKRQAEYTAKQRQNVDSFLRGIKSAVQEGKNRLESTDAAQLKAQKASKEKLRAAASVDVDNAFEESVYQFKTELSSTLKANTRNLFDKVSDFSQYEKHETKTKEVAHTRVKGTGFLNWISGGRWGNETYYTTKSYEVHTLQTAPIKSNLNNIMQTFQEDLIDCAEKAVFEWRSSVQSKTISALRDSVGDDDIDISLLKTSIRKVVGNMQIPSISLSSQKFTSEYSGVLTGEDKIYEFLEAAAEYRDNLRSTYSSQIRTFLSEMESSAKKERLSDLLFGNMDKELSELEKQIANKESTLKRYCDCLAALETLE